MIWVTVRDLQPCEIVTYCGLWSNYVCMCKLVWMCVCVGEGSMYILPMKISPRIIHPLIDSHYLT